MSHPARAGFFLGWIPKNLVFFSFFAQPGEWKKERKNGESALSDRPRTADM